MMDIIVSLASSLYELGAATVVSLAEMIAGDAAASVINIGNPTNASQFLAEILVEKGKDKLEDMAKDLDKKISELTAKEHSVDKKSGKYKKLKQAKEKLLREKVALSLAVQNLDEHNINRVVLRRHNDREKEEILNRITERINRNRPPTASTSSEEERERFERRERRRAPRESSPPPQRQPYTPLGHGLSDAARARMGAGMPVEDALGSLVTTMGRLRIPSSTSPQLRGLSGPTSPEARKEAVRSLLSGAGVEVISGQSSPILRQTSPANIPSPGLSERVMAELRTAAAQGRIAYPSARRRK